MQIPKRITVGSKTYDVIKLKAVDNDSKLGRIDYFNEVIWLATHDSRGNKLAQSEVVDTFWHELTHAVLHDMRNALRDDEKFVTAFSHRFSTAINSAQL